MATIQKSFQQEIVTIQKIIQNQKRRRVRMFQETAKETSIRNTGNEERGKTVRAS